MFNVDKGYHDGSADRTMLEDSLLIKDTSGHVKVIVRVYRCYLGGFLDEPERPALPYRIFFAERT